LWPSDRDAVRLPARPFELQDVRLLDGPFRDAMEKTRNRHARQSVEVVLRLKGQKSPSNLTIHTLTSPDIHSVNTWERPDEVRSRVRAVAESSASITLPPHSVNIFEFPLPTND
jgi:alpha-L-arabinofuranosidase